MNDQFSQPVVAPVPTPVEVPAIQPTYVQTEADKNGVDQR